ncbi:MAG: DUF3089 domain-containing protein [Caulobacteraceae bacterium]|nr:DUF3089 domain-containing protein [Caulobacteraceae bacterium]
MLAAGQRKNLETPVPHHRLVVAALAALALGGGVRSTAVAQEAPAAARPAANDYADGANWLCRPGRQDACAVDLSATVVAADGTLTPEPFKAAAAPAIDCFYVYPTVSNDPTPNSDMKPGPEELGVVKQQFARFASRCRTFAPLYRQVTLTALKQLMTGHQVQIDRALAYDDVRDAWNHYLQHDNGGRGVVLIGHSQGANVLKALIEREIDGKPVQARVVSAVLLGSNIGVPPGKDVGGDFKTMPLCRAAGQTGCVVTYVSFRASSPPPAGSRFGKADQPGLVAGCTNPAALAGGKAGLHAYLAARGSGLGDSAEGPAWVKGKTVTTPFVSVPGLLSAECVSRDGFDYLAVSVNGDPAGPRASDIAGDVVAYGTVLRDWGLHLIDVNEAMGNLLDVVGAQSAAWTARKGR